MFSTLHYDAKPIMRRHGWLVQKDESQWLEKDVLEKESRHDCRVLANKVLFGE